MISFTIRIAPHGKLAPRPVKRGNHASLVTHPKSRAYMENFSAQAVQHAPAAPFAGPLLVKLVFTFPVPPSWAKWEQEAALAGELLHESKPDVDNCQKAALDALTKTGAFWRDDAQIVRIDAGKKYGACPSVWVEIVPCVQMASAVWKSRMASSKATVARHAIALPETRSGTTDGQDERHGQENGQGA